MLKPIKNLIVEKFQNKLPKELLDVLPSGYQRIGDIIIVNINPEVEKYGNEIGKIILENVPNVRVVCKKSGTVHTKKRLPRLKVISGDRNTETVHREGGCIFKFDVRRLMFSKGNVNERQRIQRQIKENETIVDMFCGLGYWSVGIAKFSNPEKVYAIDINPIAIKYLKENIRLNKVESRIVPLLGDCRKIIGKLGKIADRVIMGYLPDTRNFLNSAFSVLKEDGGVIHYHDVFRKEDLFSKPLSLLKNISNNNGYRLTKILHKRIVKSYAPKTYHVAVDAEFAKI